MIARADARKPEKAAKKGVYNSETESERRRDGGGGRRESEEEERRVRREGKIVVLERPQKPLRRAAGLVRCGVRAKRREHGGTSE